MPGLIIIKLYTIFAFEKHTCIPALKSMVSRSRTVEHGEPHR